MGAVEFEELSAPATAPRNVRENYGAGVTPITREVTDEHVERIRHLRLDRKARSGSERGSSGYMAST